MEKTENMLKERDNQALARRIGHLAREMGASHAGIADLRRMHEIQPKSFEECGPLLTGISICVPENDDLLDGLPMTDDAYRTSHYNEKIGLALKIGNRIAAMLDDAGYNAHRLSHPPKKGPTGLYKAVAHLAGIGWIGKNRLLITPERGPRVALAAVLTDAPLPPTADKPMENRCGTCTRCIDICPTRCFSTEPFGETDSLKGFKTGFCALNRGTINPTYWGGCGLCMKTCPFGWRQGNLLEDAVESAIRKEERV